MPCTLPFLIVGGSNKEGVIYQSDFVVLGAIHLMKIILQKVHTLSGFAHPPPPPPLV